MFDRFIRLARAKKALHEQRYLDALQQASDPLIEADRRSERVRAEATEQLIRRARSRLESGDVSTALAEAKRLKQLVGGEAVADLLRVAEQATERGEEARTEFRTTRAELRRLVDSGDLAAAESLLASAPLSDADKSSMIALVASRRKEAVAVLDRAVVDAGKASVAGAIDGYQQAIAMDRGMPQAALSSALRKLAVAAVADLETTAKIRKADAAQLATILSGYAQLVAKLPALASEAKFAAIHEQVAEAVGRCFRSVVSLQDAAQLARSVRSSGVPVGAEIDHVIAALLALAESGDAQPHTRAAVLAQLQTHATQNGYRQLAKLAGAGVASAVAGEERLDAARALLEQGNLEAARAMFVAFLNDNPMHEGVQKELELVDEGMADLDRRLADVRMALRAGRLREACTGAMALVGTARIATEAQQILAEARARMTLVDTGLDEVRVSLHGRAAATQEGVRHCLKRLEELAKVQVDHEELPRVMQAVVAEIEALDQCAKAEAALLRADLAVVEHAVPTLVAGRKNLLAVERIDAKLCQLGDGVLQFGDRALSDGRLAVVLRCVGVLQQLEIVRSDFAVRASSWQQEHEQREVAVGQLLRDARSRLIDRDLADAERLVEEAQGTWRESAEVQAFAHQLQKLRKQTHTLEQVAAMAEDKDFLGAHQKLASMPNVPPMLRTRVYDMKQDLARAQGLEGSFLLRVDEGGEQLVMRGESVSIGNVRQSSADLPVLANIAGRHATIRRSMSFHGGMEDSILAEEGEVRVGGKKVKKHVLKTGDKVHLGPALGMLYQKPTSRSLTSRMLLQSGFQVAGTDRILLMKDRGRDGRILIGPGRDVHVTVAKATGEVELFASNSGQMRIFCEQGGSIDGTVFKGEHPVAAGQVIEACGITFLLMPWQAMP
tara:strand:- start:67406 stop:70096 length:2691 start_codon:yes stop_codon:yes gene_type:complete